MAGPTPSETSLPWKTTSGLEQSGAVFDRATRLAKALFGAVGTQITLIDSDGIWTSGGQKRREGEDAVAVRLAMATGELLWVEDGRSDPRFREAPAVTRSPYLRFFAAAPIRLEDGSTPGAIWVAASEPRAFDVELAERLQDLADFVADEWTRVQAKKLRDAARRESDVAQRMVAQIIETAPLSLVMTDCDIRVIAASPRWIESRQLVGEAVIGRSLYELYPDTYEQWRPVYDHCLQGEPAHADRVEFTRPDGSTIWLQVEVTPWRDGAGGIGGLIMTSHDVTGMVEALERTERSEERLRLAIETADIHVWELDYRSRELVSVGAADTFFSEPQRYEDLARDIYSSVDPRDVPSVKAQWDRHVNEGVPYSPEYRVVRSDDREVWVQGAVRFLQDDAGRPLRMVGALQNITRRKASEAALVHAKEEAESATRAKSAFLATMSHEISTSLRIASRLSPD